MKTTLLLLFTLITGAVYAQVFPVQVSPQLVPPYSPYLSDFTAPGAQNLIVRIRTNDLSLSHYACKLRITIEGAGITLRTKPNFITRPVILEGGGIPQVFYGEDLLDYFHPDALDFLGLSKREYERSGRLPEGVYRFSMEVLDYNRGTVVSNRGMAMAWIILNDPPLLNSPSNLSRVKVEGPTNILFTWTPRHSGSPNAAFTTEYTFRLIEIWPENRNPYDAFLTQSPLFETSLTQNQLHYGMAEPALVPGRKYAWQLEARDAAGRDLFKNKGRSEVFVFQYGDALVSPKNFQLRWAKATTLSMRWDPVFVEGEKVRYRVQYRPRLRTENRQWYETSTQFAEKTLYHLAPDTDYEMRVRTELTSQESPYSDIRIFRTLHTKKDEFLCRDPVTPPPLPLNTLPVFPLQANDTLHAGGYDIVVRDVLEVQGKYHGSGIAIVPWLNAAKVRVTFENIRVNDRFWLTHGIVKSVWNVESKFLLEEQTPVLPGNTPKAGEIVITIVGADSLITVEGMAVVAVTKDNAGNVVVTTTDGRQQTFSKGKSYAIVDDVGNGYVIDKQGNIAKTTATEAKAAAARGDRNYDFVIEFVRGKSKLGFDEKKYDALARFYEQPGQTSYVAWKALSTAQPDAIEARLFSQDIDIEQINFQAGATPVMPASSRQQTVKLNLHGKVAGMEEELLALYSASDTLPGKVVGKLNLATYTPVHYNLEVVPVNNASLPSGLDARAISEALNRIYNQAVVEWRVNLSKTINVELPTTFDDGETGVFSNYTADMKKVLDVYGRLRDNTYYLFLIDEPRNHESLGYMPRSRQAGFVFVGPHRGNAEEFVKTMAHELGHGAFNLKHTFSEHSVPLGTTDNVMDYGSGTALYKYQWDQIHSPQSVVRLFESDKEGGSVVVLESRFLERLGIESAKTNCEKLAVARAYEVYKRFDMEIAIYAGFLRLLLCQTEKENCNINPLPCGLTNGLLQELDWIATVETVEGWNIDPEEILLCALNSIPIGSKPDDNLTLGGILFKCLVGIEIKDLNNAIKDFIVANYDDPYYQGQATAFAITLLSPFKAKLLEKLAKIPRYAKKLTSFKFLSKAKDSDELVRISKSLADQNAEELADVIVMSQPVFDLPSPVGKFRQLIGANKKTYRAADFWKQKNERSKIVTSNDGKYVIKHDPTSGQMLFADVESKQFIGFALDEENLIQGDYDRLLKNLKTIHGLPGGARSISIRGTTIKLSEDRANFLFGKYEPNNVPGIVGEIGTDDIINELAILKNYSFADEVFELRPGSVHVLNIPDNMPINAGESFFDAYNKDFMDKVIRNRNTVNVVLISDPRKETLLDQFVESTREFSGRPSGFAKEIRYFRDRGVTHFSFVDGTLIDITKIELDDLDWLGWKY